MFDSLAALGAAQSVRTTTFPIQLASPSPTLEWLLETPRERNAALDALFYDVGKLTLEEAREVALRYAAEGAILEVSPSGGPHMRIWRDVDDFTPPHEEYAALVAAGVGSSALGTAAFARNVADAAGSPVLAVVSGYGLADLLTEAIGGYFLFGMLNSTRHAFEWLDELRLAKAEELPNAHPGPTGMRFSDLARRSEDVRTVQALLSGPVRFRWLVGHSKGNLVLSEALYALCEHDKPVYERLCENSAIITVSAKIAMPRGLTPIVDVMGQLDGFGALNSRMGIETDVEVPTAWHHTNTELPFHLPVADTLRPLMAGAN